MIEVFVVEQGWGGQWVRGASQLLDRGDAHWRACYRAFPCCTEIDDFEHAYWPRIQRIYALFLQWPLLTQGRALAIYLASEEVAISAKNALQHRVLFGRIWAQLLRETRESPLRPE